MTPIIAMTTTTTAAEIVAKIYHGVILDIISEKENSVLVSLMDNTN